MLYWKHFSLSSNPFPVTPESEAFFLGGSRKSVAEALRYVLTRESGIIKVVGDSGSGKTTMCRWLMRELADTHRVIYTCDPSLAGDQTLYAIGERLGLDLTRGAREDIAAAVRQRLVALHDAGQPVVLLVDEAHALAPETLEQLRLLAQHESGGGERMRIALFGPEELDHELALASLAAVRTRIAHSLRLRRLKLADIAEYLRFKMTSAGYTGPRVFSDNAVRAVSRLSAGIPRRINLIADKALLAAAVDNRYEVRARDVAAAASEIRLARRRDGPPRWTIPAAAGFVAGITVAGAAFAMAWTIGLGGVVGPAEPGRQEANAAAGTPDGTKKGAPGRQSAGSASLASATPHDPYAVWLMPYDQGGPVPGLPAIDIGLPKGRFAQEIPPAVPGR